MLHLLSRGLASRTSRASACPGSRRWVSYPCLLRDFLHEALYAKNEGYFSKNASIGIGNAGNPDTIHFPSLYDEADYHSHVSDMYTKGRGGWLTPVEIFRPWYGMAIARHILQLYTPGRGPLRIIEIGGGSGTCMVDVMHHIRQAEPLLFTDTKYTVVEISSALAAAQKHRAQAAGMDENNYEILNVNCLHMQSVLSDSHNTFAIALEVLDNLPHDKIVFDGQSQPWQCEIHSISTPVSSNLKTQQGISALTVNSLPSIEGSSVKYQELYSKACDSRIIQCLGLLCMAETSVDARKTRERSGENWLKRIGDSVWRNFIHKTSGHLDISRVGVPTVTSAVQSSTGIAYIPTCQIQFLEMLGRCLPHHKLILSDFDAIPGVVMEGANGPAVQVTTQGTIQEIGNYLLPDFGSADIFFPTDFSGLKGAYENVVGKPAVVMTPEEFFSRFASVVEGTTTHSGYNPLFQDYVNTALLVTDYCMHSENRAQTFDMRNQVL